MADNKIMEEIFKTIDIITDRKLYLTEYVYTEDCTIIASTNDAFTYRVLFQKEEFEAHSPIGESFEVGQTVVVLFTDYSKITKKIILYGQSPTSGSIKTLNETRITDYLRIKSGFYTSNGVDYGSRNPYLVFEPNLYSSSQYTSFVATPGISIINPYVSDYTWNPVQFYSSFFQTGSFIETRFPLGDLKVLTDKQNPIAYNERGMSIVPSAIYEPAVRISSPSASPLDLATRYQPFLTNFYYNTAWVGSIYTDGNGLYWFSLSDYRLKENIAPLDSKSSIERIKNLNPVSFNWKKDGSLSEGFIAHEVQDIIPNSVNGAKDATKSDGSEKYQALDTSTMIPTLVSAVKELVSEIEQLKIEIQQLKGGSP